MGKAFTLQPPSQRFPLAEGQGNADGEMEKITNPQIGETVKYLRTGDIFQVKKVTPKIVILNSQVGLSQVMTPTESFDLVFKKIIPAQPLR